MQNSANPRAAWKYSIMTNVLRQEIAALATTLVVKVGTQVLSQDDGTLNYARIEQLGRQLHDVVQSGRKVVLVSSGAVGAGMGRLGMTARPTDLPRLQAVAAIGQSLLVEAYERALSPLGHHAAQVLLTAEDLEHRPRYLNARNTLLTLLELGAIPIINENDTVSTDEFRTKFGDNDRLAAIVTNLIRARYWCCSPTWRDFATAIPASKAPRSSTRWTGSTARSTTSSATARAGAVRAAWQASSRPPGCVPARVKT